MHEPDLISLFVAPLNRLGIRYAATGAFAAIYYGHPRITHDIDLVALISPDQIQRLADVFPSEDFYVPSAETIVEESARPEHGHFNVIHPASALRADIYLAGKDPLQHWALDESQQVQIGTEVVAIAPPEYVIVRKLQYFRDGGSSKHLTDIRAMLLELGGQLDVDLIRRHVDELHLAPEWATASAK